MEASVKAHSFLKRISGPDVGKIYPLYSRRCTLGRAFHNTVCLNDAFLSRKHCSITYENSSWIITDYGGLNGTYLNGKRMESSSYCDLNDKTILFLGDPEESTCGFIFLTSLPASAQLSESSRESIPSTSEVAASFSSPLPSNLGQPSTSTSVELIDISDPRPDQSEDISSTRSVISLDRIIERPSRSLSCHDNSQPDNKNKFKERMEKLRQVSQSSNPTPVTPNDGMLSPLNERVLPILFDANTESPRSTLRSNMNSLYKPIEPIFNLYNTLESSRSTELISSILPGQIVSGTNGLEQSRGSMSAQRTSPNVAGSSTVIGSNARSPRLTLRRNVNSLSSLTEPTLNLYNPSEPFRRREIFSSIVPSLPASGSSGLEQSRDSTSAQRTSYVAGSSRDIPSKPCEFDVLDMLVDSVNSDQSDSDCSISSMDSLRTRIRKQKVRANRALADEKKQSPRNSLSKRGNASSSSDEVQLMESSLPEILKSEDDSANFQDSESLIYNNKEEVEESKNEMADEVWITACTSKPDDSDTLQYLKDRVLKLQKHVMDITRELNEAVEKDKEQTLIIEELQKKQAIAKEEVVEDLEAELSCNICTEVLIKPVILNCGHIFCQYCIGVWKKKKKQCPNCRDTIKTESEVRVLDNYIGKAIDRLEPMYRMKRNELLESRKTQAANLKKSSRKRSPYHRVPSSAETTSTTSTILGLRSSRNNSPIIRRGLTLRLRELRHEQAENPLIRRLVDRIERRNQIQTE